MMSLAALTFPNIDPIAFSIGPVSVRWYGLAYMAGLLLAWAYVRHLLATHRLWRNDTPPFGVARVDDLLLFMTLAIILGGRLGQVLLYEPGYYLANPAEILKTWRGGMSFHGALIGAALAILLFARIYKVEARSVMDLCAASVPFGLFFGRIANFINAEHWGRPTEAAIGMVFPGAGGVPRHPSQLYEAALEGLVMLLIMRIMTHKLLGLKNPGLVTGVWLVWYAIARSICEFFREPEHIHALNIAPFTAGQVYSIPMALLGVYFIVSARRAARTDEARV